MRQSISLWEATRTWARIGLSSFGGPAGQIALMHRILIDEKRWISEPQFLHALNFCMLLPGPEAQQLATYVGWMLHRVRGGLIAGTLFVLPGFVVILLLSLLYSSAADLALVKGMFAGLKAAVIVIVLQAVVRIGRRSLRRAAPLAVAGTAFVAMYFFKAPFPLVVLTAAIAGALWPGSFMHVGHGESDDGLTPVAAGAAGWSGLRTIVLLLLLWIGPIGILVATTGVDSVWSNIAIFFSKMAVVTFGGAYAVLAYVSQEAVTTYQWLTPGEMIDGLALAETTPGPLIMVTQFVGYLAAYRNAGPIGPEFAGVLGAILTTWVTFVPCFLWIFAGAPYVERLRSNRLLSSALAGVTAAVVGVILNLCVWFIVHTLFAEVVVTSLPGVAIEVPVPDSLRLQSLAIAGIAALLLFVRRSSILAALAAAGTAGILIEGF